MKVCRILIAFAYLLLCLMNVQGQKLNEDLRKIGSFQLKDKTKLQDERLGYMPIFFDKWNNMYVCLADMVEVMVYNPRFQNKNYLKLDDVYWGSGVINNNFSTMNYHGKIFQIKNGDLINIIDISGKLNQNAFFGNIGISDDLDKKEYTGSVALDWETKQFKKMNQAELFEYIKKNGKALSLSIEKDAILYKGITWDRLGSKRKWGETQNSGWLAIDKDGLGYDISGVYNHKAELLQEIKINMSTDNPYSIIYTNCAHDFEGNIYYFKTNTIFYMGRDWGYSFLTETKAISDSELLLHAGSEEFKIGVIKSGDTISVQEKTLQKETIQGSSLPWYKVKTPDGLVGWVHGSVFMIKQEDDRQLLVYDSPALQLRGLK